MFSILGGGFSNCETFGFLRVVCGDSCVYLPLGYSMDARYIFSCPNEGKACNLRQFNQNRLNQLKDSFPS